MANGLRGDVILSKACGLIGGMLASVTTERRSHTGIMVQNYTRIRQSTALDEYVQDHPADGKKLPTDGFEPQVLRYTWPGTFESDVREAYEIGLEATDPFGKVRSVHGFSRHAARCEDGLLVFPHVLRPDGGAGS